MPLGLLKAKSVWKGGKAVEKEMVMTGSASNQRLLASAPPSLSPDESAVIDHAFRLSTCMIILHIFNDPIFINVQHHFFL